MDLEEKAEVANRLLTLQFLLIYFIFNFFLFVARVSVAQVTGWPQICNTVEDDLGSPASTFQALGLQLLCATMPGYLDSRAYLLCGMFLWEIN